MKNVKKDKRKTAIDFTVETKGMDVAIKKANQLVKLLKEAKQIIESLSKF